MVAATRRQTLSLHTLYMNRLTTPARILVCFTYFASFVGTFYAAWDMRAPALVEILTPIVFAWLFWLWLKKDSAASTVKWPSIDLGFFVYFAWFAILPYHLVRTRGARGLQGILALVGVYLLGWFSANVMIYLIWL